MPIYINDSGAVPLRRAIRDVGIRYRPNSYRPSGAHAERRKGRKPKPRGQQDKQRVEIVSLANKYRLD